MPQAYEDIADIWDFVFQDNEYQARKIIKNLEGSVQMLVDFPELGVKRYDIKPQLRCLVHGSYNVFYKLEEETILIIRILHGSRSVSDLL